MRDAEQWQRVEALVDLALQRPLDRRRPFIDRQDLDPESRSWALRLLAADEEAGVFLDHPAAELLSGEPGAAGESGGILPALDLLQAPHAIGPYRIVRHLHRGGMGNVYLARRNDGEFERHVAIKLLHFHAVGEEALARLRTERQILAHLEHPNIARLYDGGTLDDGRPYLVLEFVEGLEIDRYCACHELSVGERLGLVEQLIDALAYCHRRGLIHRDIKPGNVLVTASGIVKLIDFGIAKDLAGGASGAAVTRTGQQPRTPGYASPEQILGHRVDPASDVHAVGILLFELLTGCRLFAAAGSSLHEVEKAICEHVPPVASAAVRRWHGAVLDTSSGDTVPLRPPLPEVDLASTLRHRFDRPIARALAKSPEDRPSSVGELMAEIDDAAPNRGAARRSRWLLAGLSSLLLMARPGIPASEAGEHSTASRVEIAVPGFEAQAERVRNRAAQPLPHLPSLHKFRPNLAVWNLFDASGEQTDDHALGLSHMIVEQLARWPGLRALGNRSSWQMSTHAVGPWRVAHELGDLDIFTGRMRADQDSIHVELELLGVRRGETEWSRNWTVPIERACHLSHQIAGELAALKGLPMEPPAEGSRPPCHPRAFELLLSARALMAWHGPGGLDEAVPLLDEAVALAPQLGSAWAALTQAHIVRWQLAEGSPRDNLRRARRAARRTLQLEPAPWVELVLAITEARLEGDCRRGRALLARPNAFALPSLASRALISETGTVFGQRRLLPLVERAVAQDPFHGGALLALGYQAWLAGELELAARALERAQRIDPRTARGDFLRTHLALTRGDLVEAREAGARQKNPLFVLFSEALIENAAQQEEQAQSVLESLIEQHAETAGFQIAQILAVLGETDRAFAWLHRARQNRDPGLMHVTGDPYLASLEQDPRWPLMFPEPDCPRAPFL